MAELNITPGSRLQLCIAPEPGKTPEFDMSASYFKTIDDITFLLSIPLKGGKPVQIGETQKLLLRYDLGPEPMIMTAYCDDVVKQGIRSYWKLRKVAEQHHYFQRKDERYKVTFRLDYSHPSWMPDENGKIDREEAVTLDISAGGAALFVNSRFDVGDVIQLFMPRISQEADGAPIDDVISAICWYRDAPIGSPCRFLAGVQFRFAGDMERNRIRAYIESIRKIYKL